MHTIDRRTFIRGLGAAVTLAPGVLLRSTRIADAAGSTNPHLQMVNKDFLISTEEVKALHVAKDSMGGPTIAGSPSWRNFLGIAEKELREAGVIDLFRNAWTYERWSTSEWPDDSNWSLHVDGAKVKVANYGCNSGGTPNEEVTGALVVYKAGMPADQLKGKIAIILKPSARQYLEGKPNAEMEALTRISVGDYEYLANPDTFPNPLRPLNEIRDVSPFLEMGLARAQSELIEAGAAGALIVLGLSYDALAGTYTFPVPALHEMPSLYLDRDAGKAMVEAAKAGKRATLRLVSTVEDSETYQLFGYLPGKNYGSADDEQILLITHTDGPSISQENGALGIVSMVRYFANIPQAERPRTIMMMLDCRHYMPGMERAFAKQDYATSHPEVYDKVIVAMGIEHLGQIKVAEGDGRPYHRTELAEVSSIWTTNNQRLVDIAIKATKDNDLRRVQVQCPGRPGVHGKKQGRAYGLGAIAGRLGVAGTSVMGLMSAYWSSKARMDYLDADHFVDQIATMSQICGELMLVDVEKIKSDGA